MAVKRSSRVVINRAAMNQFETAIADGLADIMVETQERATDRPLPDDPETSRKIANTAGWAVFNGTRKVDGPASKPRTLRNRKGVITGVVGFGHPVALIFERGTAGRYQASGDYAGVIRPRPFLLPSFLSAVKDLSSTVANRIRQSPVGRKP
jgi:hypothetical protein